MSKVAVFGAVALLLTACSSGGPSNSSTDEPTVAEATPSPVPIVTFKAFALNGRGNKVPRFKIPPDTAAIATIVNRGSSNFVVTSLAADGSDNELLVNVIGAYSGTVLFDENAGTHSVAFRVESDGAWSIVVKPISAARAWKPTGRLTGKGDDVVRVVPAVSGFATATITHRGSENFVVYAWGPDVADLLVNEIGSFSGEETLPDGTTLLQVEADGSWTVTPS